MNRTLLIAFGLLLAGTAALDVMALRRATRAKQGLAAGIRTQALVHDRLARAATLPVSALPPQRKKRKGVYTSPSEGQARQMKMIADKPELRRLYLQSYRSNLNRRYGLLYRALNLSPDQIQRFEAIETADAELKLSQGSPAQESPELSSALTALLGTDGYQQFEVFSRAEPIRQALFDNPDRWASSAGPAQPEQLVQLSAVLANASGGYQDGEAADWNTINWADALPAAEKILAPEQFAVLRNMADMAGVSQLGRAYFQQELDSYRAKAGTPP